MTTDCNWILSSVFSLIPFYCGLFFQIYWAPAFVPHISHSYQYIENLFCLFHCSWGAYCRQLLLLNVLLSPILFELQFKLFEFHQTIIAWIKKSRRKLWLVHGYFYGQEFMRSDNSFGMHQMFGCFFHQNRNSLKIKT